MGKGCRESTVGPCRQREVVEEGRGVDVALVEGVPDITMVARGEPRRRQCGLPGTGRTGHPDRRMLAGPVQSREKLRARHQFRHVGRGEFREPRRMALHQRCLACAPLRGVTRCARGAAVGRDAARAAAGYRKASGPPRSIACCTCLPLFFGGWLGLARSSRGPEWTLSALSASHCPSLHFLKMARLSRKSKSTKLVDFSRSLDLKRDLLRTGAFEIDFYIEELSRSG